MFLRCLTFFHVQPGLLVVLQNFDFNFVDLVDRIICQEDPSKHEPTYFNYMQYLLRTLTSKIVADPINWDHSTLSSVDDC